MLLYLKFWTIELNFPSRPQPVKQNCCLFKTKWFFHHFSHSPMFFTWKIRIIKMIACIYFKGFSIKSMHAWFFMSKNDCQMKLIWDWLNIKKFPTHPEPTPGYMTHTYLHKQCQTRGAIVCADNHTCNASGDSPIQTSFMVENKYYKKSVSSRIITPSCA